jgi:hypothetical protein
MPKEARMKIKSKILMVFVLIAGLTLSGCALSHEPIFRITNPQNGNVFGLNDRVTIRVRVFRNSISNFGSYDWHFYQWRLFDGNTIIASGGASTSIGTFEFVIDTSAGGPHYITAQARAGRPDPDFADLPVNPYFVYSDWMDSNEVCFFVGPDAPSDFCSVRTIVQPLVVASITPTPIPPTPTATPVTPIPVRRNPNQHGGSGCSQYNTQSSCNLAGCSWNGSSCTVNP